MTASVAYLPGTFDPPTRGHMDLALRAAALFDRVVVGVVDGDGATWFTADERVALWQASLRDASAPQRERIAVETFSGLAVRAAQQAGARVLVRGARSMTDWEYELRMAQANRHLAGDLDTIVLPPSAAVETISGTLVREVVRLGGDPAAWVSPSVARALAERRAARATLHSSKQK